MIPEELLAETGTLPGAVPFRTTKPTTGESEMGYYMIQTAFTADAWATMLKNPQNRAEQVRPMIEKLGGKLEGYWSCFGDYDTVLIVQAPDNVGAAALALAAAGGGALRSA